MRREPVESRSLRSIGYDPPSQTLEVEFRNGRVYRYSGVPPEQHQALLAAESRGAYFNAEIRDVFPALQVG
jgi:hypothetical protein